MGRFFNRRLLLPFVGVAVAMGMAKKNPFLAVLSVLGGIGLDVLMKQVADESKRAA